METIVDVPTLFRNANLYLSLWRAQKYFLFFCLQDVLDILRASFNEAHRVIMEKEGGLTTLCACLVCPVRNSNQYAVCCLNVGDSYGYIYSHNQGKIKLIHSFV